jgi:ubiquinone/menaquinone biosynthesis C-methylase UbiE
MGKQRMIAKIKPFEEYTEKYEDWFEENRYAYQSEVNAVKDILPEFKNAVEIGVGSGKFALPLDIKLGIEPSAGMRKIARSRGIRVIDAAAEDLPFEDGSFDLALMVTTLCFLDDAKKAFSEVCRILKPDGYFINGFVDKNSKVGKIYQKHKHKSIFYNIATFYSTEEVIDLLKESGFKNFEFRQTIFNTLDNIDKIEPVKEGYGEGSFMAVRAQK